MRLDDLLHDDAEREHANPLAGRGPRIVKAAQRRRHQRRAGALGVAALALIAVTIVVPGPWRGIPVVNDATTAPTTEPSGPTEPGTSGDPVAPVSVCDVTNQVLSPGDLSDVDATMAVSETEVAVTLTNTTDEIRDVRETGNEVWLVDAGTGRVVAHQADLTVPLGRPLQPGEAALITEDLALTPCPEGPTADGSYLLYVRGSVIDSEPWLAGPVDVVLVEDWLAPSTEPAASAVRPELCEVPYANVNPPDLPTPPALGSDVQVRDVSLAVGTGPEAHIVLGNTADEPRTIRQDAAEFFLVDRLTLETVGYAAVDAEPRELVLEPGEPTELWQSFEPRSCAGDPLPDGWYLLFARGAVVESGPWLAHPTLIGWVDGEPGTPPSDAATEPADPPRAVPIDPHAWPWVTPDTSGSGLTIEGSMPTVPRSSRWDGAESISEIATLTNNGSERFQATAWSWVILVEPDGEQPLSIAVDPPWTLPRDIDLAPGESEHIPAVQWLGSAAAFEHKLWTDPAIFPGTYDAYIALVDAASYDPVTGTGFSYAIAGPYPITVD